MWKEHLGDIKIVIEFLILLLTFAGNLYVAMTSGLTDFWKGFVIGSTIIFAVAVVSQIILGFWKISMSDAQQIATRHMKKTEPLVRHDTIPLNIMHTEYNQKENWWHVFGEFSVVAYWTFEVAVDARTGSVRKSKLEPHEHDVVAIHKPP